MIARDVNSKLQNCKNTKWGQNFTKLWWPAACTGFAERDIFKGFLGRAAAAGTWYHRTAGGGGQLCVVAKRQTIHQQHVGRTQSCGFVASPATEEDSAGGATEMPVPLADAAGRLLACYMVDEVCLQKAGQFAL